MSEDARFEDGREAPLNLGAMDADDLAIISALVQDAVFPASEIAWQPRARRFAILLNRFRWENGARAQLGPERVQSLLVFDTVQKVSSQGVALGASDMVLSLLSLEWRETAAPSGEVLLQLAGDGAIRLEIEALDVSLRDVTRPYAAPSGRRPEHGV